MKSDNRTKTKHLIMASGVASAIDSKPLNSGDNHFDPAFVFLGRTLIEWQIHNIYSEENGDCIFVIVDKGNVKLLTILENLTKKYIGIKVISVLNSKNIFESLLAALADKDKIKNVEVVFADVLLFNFISEFEDEIVISDKVFMPKFWSYVKKEIDGSLRIIDFPDHLDDLENMNVMIGRYRFSDLELLEEIAQKCKLNSYSLFSMLLLEYHSRKNLSLSFTPRSNWFDFGHVSEFNLGLKKTLSSRYFNRVEVDLGIGVVTKVSTNKDKLEDEKLWYLEMHNLIPLNVPKVYGFENLGDFARLEIEYIPGRNLAELAIQEDEKSIRATLDGELLSILLIFAQNVTRNVKVIEFSNEMYYLKTESRLKDLIKTGDKKVVKLILNGVELNGRYHPPILTVLESMQKQLKDLASTALYGPIHGDLCFSNIILRDKSEKVSLVDPRGRFGQKGASIYGDLRYDLAKLRHSYVSGYDLIKAGVSHFVLEGETYKRSSSSLIPMSAALHFENLVKRLNYKIEEVELIESLLFLSMLPLHNDEPGEQIQMLLTALEIMAKFSNIVK